MGGIVTDFLYEVINEVVMTFFGSMFEGIIDMAFFAETYISEVFSSSTFSNLYSFIYTVSISLIVIKFLKKGFFVYILWRDGDADTSPVETIASLALATFIMAAFPTMYKYVVDMAMWFIGEISLELGGFATVPDPEVLLDMFMADNSLLKGIQLVIYLVLMLLMYFKYIKLGVELLILRLGVPFACSGLVDSDGGVFKPYMGQLLKAVFTVIIQHFCLTLSVAVALRQPDLSGIWWSIALCAAALSTPQMLSSFLLVSGGGGGKATAAVNTASTMMRLFRK